MDRGILYVATDDDLVDEAILSAESARSAIEDVSLGIVVEGEKSVDYFDTVINLKSPSYGFKDKIKGMNKSPFNKTIYLDTDTYIHEDISEIFSLLNRFDIAATHNPNRDLYTNTALGVPECFPEYNTGVIAFNKTLRDGFFTEWCENYSEDHLGDQPSFRKVLYNSDIKTATLPREYNYLPRYPAHLVKDVKIFHGRLLDIDTKGANKWFDIRDLVEDINRIDGHRLYLAGGYYVGPDLPILQRIRKILNERGLTGTIKGVKNVLRRRYTQSSKDSQREDS